MRSERQRLLSTDAAPRGWFVLDEAALRRQVGSAEIMAGQAQRLLEVGRAANITVQVIPNADGAHPGQDGAFTSWSSPRTWSGTWSTSRACSGTSSWTGSRTCAATGTPSPR